MLTSATGMFDSDYWIRVHRHWGDSGQGEPEGTNSAIGDAVVDGSTIDQEKYNIFDSVTVLETRRTQANAWAFSKELVYSGLMVLQD